jgi:hypothetical protein
MATMTSRIRRVSLVLGAALILSGGALASPASADGPWSVGDPVPTQLSECFGRPYQRITFLNGQIVGVPTPGVIYAEPGATSTNGTPGDDVIIGTSGHDFINGFGGNDTICGGDGWDILIGGLVGFEGTDADSIDGEGDSDELRGGPDNDILYGSGGADSIFGEDGEDELWGNAGRDYLNCGEDFDVADGGGGPDDLSLSHECEIYVNI